MWGLRSQSVELFGRPAARLTASCKLPFAQHVHEFNAGEGGLRGVQRFEPSHRPRHSFHAAVILLHDIIAILGLADDDRGAVFGLIALEGRFVGRAPINGDFLRHAVAADRLLENPQGRRLIAGFGEQKVDGLTLRIDRPIAIAPLAFDLNIRLIPPPTAPHRTLAPMECFLAEGALFDDPPVDGGVIDLPPSCLPEFFHMARAQRVRHIPTDTHENDFWGDMGPFDTAHHRRAPS